MPHTFNYPVEIERSEDGRCFGTFPDFGGATDGATREEALDEANALLRGLIATTIREGQALPELSRSSNSQRRLARYLSVAESEMQRMLNPDHTTKARHDGRGLTADRNLCLPDRE